MKPQRPRYPLLVAFGVVGAAVLLGFVLGVLLYVR
jgi:hypothetical protein